MRPRHFGRGIPDAGVYPGPGERASMRPRHFGRGISTFPARTLRRYLGRFNEAAAFRPRNRGSAESGDAGRCSFNEAAAFRPRNRASRMLVERHAARASMRPRHFGRGIKRSRPRSAPGTPGASMRPRHFGRGIAASSRRHPSHPRRFNEAAAFRPRNRQGGLHEDSRHAALQ